MIRDVWTFLVAQLVKNPPAMQETLVWFWVGKIPRKRNRLPTPVFMGFPGGVDGKVSACNAGDLVSIPGLIPWRRAWQPTPVFLPGESPWKEEPGGLQTTGSQRVRHDWASKHSIADLWNYHLDQDWELPASQSCPHQYLLSWQRELLFYLLSPTLVSACFWS